jgi:hypothetical protein
MFAEPDASICRCFVQRVFGASAIEAVTITGLPKAGDGEPAVELHFDATQYNRRQVLGQVAAACGSELRGRPR